MGSLRTLQNQQTKLYLSVPTNPSVTSDVTVETTQVPFVMTPVVGGVYTYVIPPPQRRGARCSSTACSISTQDTGVFVGASTAQSGAKVSCASAYTHSGAVTNISLLEKLVLSQGGTGHLFQWNIAN